MFAKILLMRSAISSPRLIKNAKDTVTKKQKELIDSEVKKYAENGITGLYLDIKMTKKIGDDYKAAVSELSTPATFSVKIADELKNMDVTTYTPIEAMNKLYELANRAKEI